MKTIRPVDPRIARKLREPLVYREIWMRKEKVKVSMCFFRSIFLALFALSVDCVLTLAFSSIDPLAISDSLTLENIWVVLLFLGLVMHIWSNQYERELKIRDMLINLRINVRGPNVFYVQNIEEVYGHIFAYVFSPYLNDPTANEDKVDYLLEENDAKLKRFNQDKVYSFFDKIFNPGKRIRYLIADEEKVENIVKENEKILKEDIRDKE